MGRAFKTGLNRVLARGPCRIPFHSEFDVNWSGFPEQGQAMLAEVKTSPGDDFG
ncbi:hypothetical protein ROA7745_01602 [Roseovarius aestuarii]|uniref:Uncharacterized protein n=1 Tax=Roseovarius aestuarii TaxID=475083 RepID=A0A1X7BQE4_9RHOB|nr:hypothetical protein ROA7745_01602 [Roseovarius aestuarii]